MPSRLSQRPWVAWTCHPTPLGPMLLAATAQGLGGAWFEGQAHHPGSLPGCANPQHPTLVRAAAALDAYWADSQNASFDLPFDPGGTVFQQRVWQALVHITPGHTQSYGELARALGQVHAARAVGAAVGRNPLSIFVPCHRVVGSQGQLTGYAGGLDRKVALLRAEAPA